jgi:hypothetical protein
VIDMCIVEDHFAKSLVLEAELHLLPKKSFVPRRRNMLIK